MQEVNLIGVLSTGGSGRLPVIEPKTITENGTYTAPEGVDGYNPIIVDVPQNMPLLEDKYITENGLYGPSEGYDGIRSVNVDVPVPSILPLTITENGVYESSGGSGFNPITVNVPTGLSYDGSIFENGTIDDSNFYIINYLNIISNNELVFSGAHCGFNITCKTDRMWLIDIEFDEPNFESQIGISNDYSVNTNQIIGSGNNRVIYGAYTITNNHLILSGFGNYGVFIGGTYNDSSISFTVKSIKYKLF